MIKKYSLVMSFYYFTSNLKEYTLWKCAKMGLKAKTNKYIFPITWMQWELEGKLPADVWVFIGRGPMLSLVYICPRAGGWGRRDFVQCPKQPSLSTGFLSQRAPGSHDNCSCPDQNVQLFAPGKGAQLLW